MLINRHCINYCLSTFKGRHYLYFIILFLGLNKSFNKYNSFISEKKFYILIYQDINSLKQYGNQFTAYVKVTLLMMRVHWLIYIVINNYKIMITKTFMRKKTSQSFQPSSPLLSRKWQDLIHEKSVEEHSIKTSTSLVSSQSQSHRSTKENDSETIFSSYTDEQEEVSNEEGGTYVIVEVRGESKTIDICSQQKFLTSIKKLQEESFLSRNTILALQIVTLRRILSFKPDLRPLYERIMRSYIQHRFRQL